MKPAATDAEITVTPASEAQDIAGTPPREIQNDRPSSFAYKGAGLETQGQGAGTRGASLDCP
jgi:hypothetical protein